MWSKVKALPAVLGTGLLVLGTQVHAAVPAAVTTAIDDMSDDSIAVATGFLVASILLTAFLFMKRGAR